MSSTKVEMLEFASIKQSVNPGSKIPMVESNVIPEGATCQEASIHSYAMYLPCGEPAKEIVYHEKDGRCYLMCAPCADHNVRNRGGKLIKQGKNTRVSLFTARLFLRAFEELLAGGNGHGIDRWCQALRSGENEGVDWERKPETDLEREVAGLRRVWYHDGSKTARKLVCVAAARLKFEIEEEERAK